MRYCREVSFRKVYGERLPSGSNETDGNKMKQKATEAKSNN
jgi:hypothetical protein